MLAYYNENNPYAAQWLRNLESAGAISAGGVDDRSIVEVCADDLQGYTRCHFFSGIAGWDHALNLAGWPKDLPVWTGSCPCQPFSSSGLKKGFADERHLWPEFFRIIKMGRPGVIMGEQVSSPDALSWLDVVFDDLESEGYSCRAVDTCAAGVGAPNIRQRLYWIAEIPEFMADYMRERRARGQRNRELQKEDGEEIGHGSRISYKPGLLADPRRQRDELGRHNMGEEAGVIKGETREQWVRTYLGNGGSVELIGDSNGPGSQVRQEPDEQRGTLRNQGSTPGETGDLCGEGEVPLWGFWRYAKWIPCRDGKFRSVDPGTFPLDHGVPKRVAKLRAIGNAIVPQVAQKVIEAYMIARGIDPE